MPFVWGLRATVCVSHYDFKYFFSPGGSLTGLSFEISYTSYLLPSVLHLKYLTSLSFDLVRSTLVIFSENLIELMSLISLSLMPMMHILYYGME